MVNDKKLYVDEDSDSVSIIDSKTVNQVTKKSRMTKRDNVKAIVNSMTNNDIVNEVDLVSPQEAIAEIQSVIDRREKAVLKKYNKNGTTGKLFEEGKNPTIPYLLLYNKGKVNGRRIGFGNGYISRGEIKPLIDSYFSFCADNEIAYSVPSFALYLGVSKKRLMEWVEGVEMIEFGAELDYAMTVIQSFTEAMAGLQKINPVMYMFTAKNYFGMRDVKTNVNIEEKRLTVNEIDNIIGNVPDTEN